MPPIPTWSTMKTANKKLLNWVNEIADLTQPESIHWCDGSDAENQALCDLMVKKGILR